MKIKMLQTCKLLGTYPIWTFHKGRLYNAVYATNQPNWKANGLVFAQKINGNENILLRKGEYEIVKHDVISEKYKE